MKIRHYSTLSLAIVASFQAHAAGFQVAEHSASGLGRAFSGEAAVAQDASVISRNPAAMTRFDRAMFSGAISIVDPEVDVTDITDPDNIERANDVAPLQVVPAGYYLSPINDKWAWGIGMFTTYGVATDYPDDISAGPLAGDTALISVNLNPSVAYRINEQFSIGLGVNFVYAHAELNRHYGFLGAPSDKPSSRNLVSMEGDTFGWGWNIGALYELNENHRFGFGYRSQVDLDFDDGDFTSDLTNAEHKAGLKVDLPAIWEVSGFHQLNEMFALHYSYQQTDWSVFKELKATSPLCPNGVCFYKEEKYDDAGRWSIGTTVTFNENWIGRLGFAYDEQAGKATLSIPDSDRYWYSIGATYMLNENWSFDAGFALVVSKDGTFSETLEANESEFTFDFESEGTAYITSLQMNYMF
ncbi:outer membrane protein transport protein [Vibrio agarivorans]|uniref:Outer membrane protein transport protein n=1 Tax=Vibrio agarivorans TaxID=153622 RepID=A0ABT7Y718_9VIBR|nr:outer membrane protein transport protein [Vibrio agarivorans]MDN2483783.1 outer membrane protein transport protein [Vibrio agarivorans]